MNQQQLLITRLLGKKEQKHIEGCQAYTDKCGKKNSDGVYICMYCSRWGGNDRYEEVSCPATLDDLCKWLSGKNTCWNISTYGINNCVLLGTDNAISYDFEKDLIDQSPETLAQIIELITKNS